MIDIKTTKLGKHAARYDSRTLKLEKYLAIDQLPPPPQSLVLSDKIKDWGMLLNDKLGDCTCAAIAHMQMCWDACTGKAVRQYSDKDIIQAYSSVSGYNPRTGANDNGASEMTVLNLYRKKGLFGEKLVAFISVNPKRIDHVRIAMNMFGGVYTGFQLPVSAQAQIDQGLWDAPADGNLGGDCEPGSWGGHAINLADYDPDGFTCITWGQPLKMTNRFMLDYCDELYVLLSADWISQATQKTPTGFDLATLQKDLGVL